MIKDHEKHKLKLQQEQEKRKRKYVEKICGGRKKKKLPDFDYQGIIKIFRFKTKEPSENGKK